MARLRSTRCKFNERIYVYSFKDDRFKKRITLKAYYCALQCWSWSNRINNFNNIANINIVNRERCE